MEKEKDIQLITAYLDSDLSDSDRLLVENRLKEDAPFAAMLKETQVLVEQVRLSNHRALMDKIKSWESELPPIVIEDLPPNGENPRKTSFWKLWIGIAAVILIAAGIYYAFYKKEKTSPRDTLVAQYFAPYPNVQLTMGSTEEALLTKAYEAYTSKSWENAARLFDQVIPTLATDTQTPPQKEKYLTAVFYQGISLLALKDGNKAVSCFSAFIAATDKDNALYEPALWYMSLAQIQAGQNPSALDTLLNIENTRYHEKGTKLKKDL